MRFETHCEPARPFLSVLRKDSCTRLGGYFATVHIHEPRHRVSSVRSANKHSGNGISKGYCYQ